MFTIELESKSIKVEVRDRIATVISEVLLIYGRYFSGLFIL